MMMLMRTRQDPINILKISNICIKLNKFHQEELQRIRKIRIINKLKWREVNRHLYPSQPLEYNMATLGTFQLTNVPNKAPPSQASKTSPCPTSVPQATKK